jgi:hypothetical protein
MAFRSFLHKDSLREAFGKGYIRVHAYTPADWGFMRREMGPFSVSCLGPPWSVQ